MRRSATRLVLTGSTALALSTVPLAGAAHATPGIGCTPIFDGGMVALVCTTVTNGQVSGSLQTFPGPATNIYLDLFKCDAAGTTCTLLTESNTTQTAAVPAKPGKYYKTCADFRIQYTPSYSWPYSGCSQVVQAPA